MTRPSERAALLADELVADGSVVTPAVAEAFRALPRHLFLPGVPLDEAYDRHRAVVLHRDRDGVALSSISAPIIQAIMLEQALIAPGMRVLEIGSGGYNAALLDRVVGEHGAVTSMDIDPEVVARARRGLRAAGVDRVEAVVGDAEDGWPDAAPYDRILVTARAWDVPPAWRTQLVADGLLVVPLEVRGLTRSIAFRRVGASLLGDDGVPCGFVPMQGLGARPRPLLEIGGHWLVDLDLSDPPDIPADDAVAVTPDVPLSVTDLSEATLWLATVFDGFGLLAGTRGGPQVAGGPLVVAPDALVLVGRLPAGKAVLNAHGPAGPALADEVAEALATWGREHRGGPGPTLTLHPADAAVAEPACGRLVGKRHTVVEIAW